MIASYASLLQFPWLASTAWDFLILDEAQAIKNPNTKQTRAAKALQARARIALTGTPIENRLSDLWSIFDFLNPGLLGSAKQFAEFSKRLGAKQPISYGPLRNLVGHTFCAGSRPTGRVISDLPGKTEVKAYCSSVASRRRSTRRRWQSSRSTSPLSTGPPRGVVLAFLMRFKQICNHPSQWLGDGAWGERDSGKLERLRELAEAVAAKQEKVLVFTQFRESSIRSRPSSADLRQPGLVLHGETAVGRRKELVKRFQDDERVPFFVLSLKVGGFGLNLTAASHVDPFRPLVEPGGGEPGDRSCVPHRADAERAGA